MHHVNREGYLISLRWPALECYNLDTKAAATSPPTPTTNVNWARLHAHAVCLYHAAWSMTWSVRAGEEGYIA